MAPIVEGIEIARTPEDVYAYIDQLDRHGEWQEAIVSSKRLTDGPVRVGTRATDRRRVPGRMKLNVTYKIVEYDPPRRTRFQRSSTDRFGRPARSRWRRSPAGRDPA
jgi:hypothetical protein